MKHQNNPNKQSGFTLAELLVVIAIIGILGTGVAWYLTQGEGTSNVTVLDNQVKAWDSAAQTYYSLNGQSFAGMDNDALITDIERIDNDAATNYTGGSNTIASDSGNIKQYTLTMSGLDSSVGKQAAMMYNGSPSKSATFSGGDLVITTTK